MAQIDEYRLRVIDAVACPACGATRTWSCGHLDRNEPVVYIHDDRSMAFQEVAEAELARSREAAERQIAAACEDRDKHATTAEAMTLAYKNSVIARLAAEAVEPGGQQ